GLFTPMAVICLSPPVVSMSLFVHRFMNTCRTRKHWLPRSGGRCGLEGCASSVVRIGGQWLKSITGCPFYLGSLALWLTDMSTFSEGSLVTISGLSPTGDFGQCGATFGYMTIQCQC
ncbi:MAG: hypothetical protein QXP27_04705, partial [Candidatus Methanomethyliaceae archaeon]